ncbi:MAG: IS1380 family transposase [Actinomycetota bacterium]|nr:IS1380 family transposase [Actinomycetota bacterium]
MKATPLVFDVGDGLVERPRGGVPSPVVEQGDDSVTGVAGVALWGPLLDRLGLVSAADDRQLRPIGPGGYTGGECYRALVEIQLAGGDFVSDRSLLADEATQRLRGETALPSASTEWRFLAGADLGRVAKAAAVNRTMLARAWALGAAPPPGLLTIDPDATFVPTYGATKEGSAFHYTHEVGLSPMIGVCGETGDVLAVRARGGAAFAGRAMGRFIDECVAAIPAAARDRYQLWVRSDSAGFGFDTMDAAERHHAFFSITAKNYAYVRAHIEALAADADTDWQPALDSADQVCDTVITMGKWTTERQVRLIVRRQRTRAGDQLSFDDLDGWRFQAVITNVPAWLATAAQVEHHHRRRGGVPEEAIRQLKHDFGLNHAPVANFFGNWLWWHAAALAYNTARWLRVLALPSALARCRGKRLRLSFLNVAARVVTHGRRLVLRLPRAYTYAAAFIEALTRIRALPAFA